MNKKYLSVALFGALMMVSTGVFTSCKDYDDDIDVRQTVFGMNIRSHRIARIGYQCQILGIAQSDGVATISERSLAPSSTRGKEQGYQYSYRI